MSKTSFLVAQIGEITENKNRIVKLQHKVAIETSLGTMRRSETYYAAVADGSLKVKKGDYTELDTNDFFITERPFVHPETGEKIMLKWLSLKG